MTVSNPWGKMYYTSSSSCGSDFILFLVTAVRTHPADLLLFETWHPFIPSNMDKTAINLVYGTNEDFGGVGSGSDVVNGTAGVFINIAKDRDTPTTTTFEFVQVLTWSFANRDPSGFLNAMKDWTFTGPITNALDKGSVAWPALGNLLTWGPIGGPIVNAMDWRGLYALKENAKNYQVNDQKNEGSKPRQR